MKIAVGTVIGGRIDLQGDPPLKEGTRVTVVAHEDGGTFELDTGAEARLVEAIAEADRGDFVDTEDFLRSLGRRG